MYTYRYRYRYVSTHRMRFTLGFRVSGSLDLMVVMSMIGVLSIRGIGEGLKTQFCVVTKSYEPSSMHA